MVERVVLVSPRGFCAWVVRAIASVERALAILPAPVYVRRAIVHNAHVVARLAAAGAKFVDELDEVPNGAVVVFSAHGVAPAVRRQASARGLRVVDATCPLVAKVHREVRRFNNLGFDVLLIGQAGHDEVTGTLGQAPNVQLVEPGTDVSGLHVKNPNKVACVTQTTLSPEDVAPVIDHVRRRFPALTQPGASDVCYATRNRQAAITWLAKNVDVVLVVGDRASSNSRQLRQVASTTGTPAFLIANVAHLQDRWVNNANVVGISAGASTPECVVSDVVAYLCRQGAALQEQVFVEERVSFGLPTELTPSPTTTGRRTPSARRRFPERVGGELALSPRVTVRG